MGDIMFFLREIKSKDDLIRDLQERNVNLLEENKNLSKQLNGERTCSGFCSSCKHGIKTETYIFGGGSRTFYLCELNCKCKDFEKVDS